MAEQLKVGETVETRFVSLTREDADEVSARLRLPLVKLSGAGLVRESEPGPLTVLHLTVDQARELHAALSAVIGKPALGGA
jgi:hypothetical protein